MTWRIRWGWFLLKWKIRYALIRPKCWIRRRLRRYDEWRALRRYYKYRKR